MILYQHIQQLHNFGQLTVSCVTITYTKNQFIVSNYFITNNLIKCFIYSKVQCSTFKFFYVKRQLENLFRFPLQIVLQSIECRGSVYQRETGKYQNQYRQALSAYLRPGFVYYDRKVKNAWLDFGDSYQLQIKTFDAYLDESETKSQAKTVQQIRLSIIGNRAIILRVERETRPCLQGCAVTRQLNSCNFPPAGN